jgi:hypothetical protein
LQIIEKWKAKSTNGNNRHQNKPVGHQHQGQRGHQRNIPPTERVNRSAQYNQQSSHSASVPSTSASQPVAEVKAKQQNNITVSTQKPVAQRNQSNRTNQKRRARKNRNRKNKPGKVNQLNKPKPVDEEMELEAEELPETSVNENSAETTTSVNIPAESNSDERTSESETSRLMYLINELLKIFTKNPGCLKLVEQAIGLFARNTSN